MTTPLRITALGRALLLLCCCGFLSFGQLAAQGYTVTTNDATFMDISASGTVLPGAQVDDAVIAFSLPFDFSYYGTNYPAGTSIGIGTNGIIFFDFAQASGDFVNDPLPTPYGPSLYPLWDDWDNEQGDIRTQVFGTAPNQMFVVQWTMRPLFPGDTQDPTVTFQVQLDEATGDIIFFYFDTTLPGAVSNQGGGATVGIQQDATTFSQFSFNEAVIMDGMSIRYAFDECANDITDPMISCVADTTLALDSLGMASLTIESLLDAGAAGPVTSSTVNFDGMFAPPTFGEQNTPNDDYSDGNLTFTNTTWEVLNVTSFTVTGLSAPNKLAYNGGTSAGVTLNFASPASELSFLAAGSATAVTGTMTATAFDAMDAELEVITMVLTSAAQSFDFTSADISRVEVTVTAGAGCLDDITYQSGAGAISDNCAVVDTTITSTAFTCDSLGMRTVTITASDAAGNEASCSVNVTVVDTIAPVLFCTDITVALDSMGNAMIENDTALDSIVEACDMDLAGPFTMGGPGARTFDCSFADSTVTRTVVATDMSGNQGSCDYEVNILDTIAPVLFCSDITIALDSMGNAMIENDTALDSIVEACDMDLAGPFTMGGPTFRTFDCSFADSTVTRTVVATDMSGNQGSCSYEVSIIDTIAPVLFCFDINIFLDSMGQVMIENNTALDSITEACGMDLSGPFTVGGPTFRTFDCSFADSTVIRTVVATDMNGNQGSCDYEVNIFDTIAPILTCQDIELDLGDDGNVIISDTSSLLLTVSDNCTDSADLVLNLMASTFNCNSGAGPMTVFTVGEVAGTLAAWEGDLAAQPTSICDCPAGYVAIGYEGMVGGLIDQMSLRCAQLNLDGTLGTQIELTCSTGTSGGGSAPQIENTGPLVGGLAGLGDYLVDFEGYAQTIAYIAGGGDNSTGFTAGGRLDGMGFDNLFPATDTPMDFAPAGNVIVGMNIYPAEMGSGYPTGLQLRYAPITQTVIDGDAQAALMVSDASGNSSVCTVNVSVNDVTPPTLSCQDLTVSLDSMGNGSIAATGDMGGTGTPVTQLAGSLDDSDPQYERTNGTTTCTAGTGTPDHSYDLFEFTIDQMDTYTFSMVPNTNGDFFASLYGGAFDPANPCDNYLIANDDGAGSSDPEIMFELTLVPGSYTLLTTQFFSGEAAPGAYEYIFSSANGGNILSGGAPVSDNVVLVAATDNCNGELTFSLSEMNFTCADVGDVPVTLTATDASGNIATCDVTVTVEDTIAPVITVTPQMIVLDDNGNAMLDVDMTAAATDACGVASVELSMTDFDCEDIGVSIVTVTATDVNGNVSMMDVAVNTGFDQPQLACISRINLTLNEDCQALLIPRMVLTGNTACLDVFNFDIVVMDDDPSNGPIIDGCGSFNYMISSTDEAGGMVNGFTGAFAEENWEVTLSGDQASATFTDETLTLTSGAVPDNDFTATDDVSVTYQFTESGTVSFDFDYILDADIIVDLFIIDFDGNIVFQSDDIDVGGAETGSGTITQDVMPGSTLVIMIDGDEFTTGNLISEVVISNFTFGNGALLGLDFETCWGIVNAEDKTPPAVTALPIAPALFCTELDDVELASLESNISRCWSVTNTGAFISYRANFQSQPVTNLNRFLTQTELGRRLVRGGGLPTVTDGCSETLEVCVNDVIQRDPLDPQCNDVLVTRRFTVTETGSCISAAGEDNDSTTDDYVLTFVRPDLDDLDGDAIDAVAEYECDDPTIVFGTNPAPRAQDFPFLEVGGRVFPLSDGANGETVCNIGVTFEDGPRIVTCPNTYKFVRTYTVIDWCEPGDIRTFTQVVKVGDTMAPTFTGPRQFDFQGNELDGLTFSTNAGNICAAYIRLDDPTITVADNCSANIFITADIYPGGDLTATPIGTFVVDLNDGNAEISSAIPVGDHVLRYTVRDDCGNEEEFDFDFSVVDRTAPVAICEDGLNISITAGQSQTDEASTGIAILTPEMIDNGSYDDCNGVSLFIARVNDANINTEPYDDQLVLTCADLGVVRVGLRVIDDLGNVNDCWLDVLVEDKARPTCFQPAPVRISCIVYNATLPADIQEATDEELDAAFGAAFGQDNCEVNIEQTIIGSLNSCGVGNFTRRFTVTDGQGFTNTNACVQSIVVYGVHDYTIEFPVDVEGDCMDIPEYDGIDETERACDLIAVNIAVDTFRSQNAAEECFKLEVVYEIINWCEYDGEGQAYIIPRDGDGLVNRNVEHPAAVPARGTGRPGGHPDG